MAKNLLVVVQSKHSVVEAEQKFHQRFKHHYLVNQERWEWVLLTDDTVKYLPVWGIKNPVRLTCGQDKRSCKPIMIEHLEWVDLKKKSQTVLFQPLPPDRQRSSWTQPEELAANLEEIVFSTFTPLQGCITVLFDVLCEVKYSWRKCQTFYYLM